MLLGVAWFCLGLICTLRIDKYSVLQILKLIASVFLHISSKVQNTGFCPVFAKLIKTAEKF